MVFEAVHIGIPYIMESCEDAVCFSPSALTSLCGLLSWLIKIPKRTKPSTFSSSSLLIVIYAGVLVLFDITWILVMSMLRPIFPSTFSKSISF